MGQLLKYALKLKTNYLTCSINVISKVRSDTNKIICMYFKAVPTVLLLFKHPVVCMKTRKLTLYRHLGQKRRSLHIPKYELKKCLNIILIKEHYY